MRKKMCKGCIKQLRPGKREEQCCLLSLVGYFHGETQDKRTHGILILGMECGTLDRVIRIQTLFHCCPKIESLGKKPTKPCGI